MAPARPEQLVQGGERLRPFEHRERRLRGRGLFLFAGPLDLSQSFAIRLEPQTY